MFEGFEKKLVDVGDVSLNCVVGGQGAPVLLLHGYPQTLAMWAQVAPVLAANYRVVCVDLRGYGDSDKPLCAADCSTYSFRTMALDNFKLMKALGFDQFHLIGHDRGARVGHRLALDFPHAVHSLAVLDILPSYDMFLEMNRHIAKAYWHWSFLAQPAPFPERMIGCDPDFFFETCLMSWGAVRLEDFNVEQLADYQRCWRMPEMLHGSCSDYRAAASIDIEHDRQDIDKKIGCPLLVFYGGEGLMAQYFDIPVVWQKRCREFKAVSLPSGHFFVDTMPGETSANLLAFLSGV